MENADLMQKFVIAQEEYTFTYQLSLGYFYSYTMSSNVGPVSYEKLLADEKVLRDGHLYQVNEEAQKAGTENSSWASYASFSSYENDIKTAFNTFLKPTKAVDISSLSFTRVYIWSDLDENYLKANIEFEYEGKKYVFKFVFREGNPEQGVCTCEEV